MNMNILGLLFVVIFITQTSLSVAFYEYFLMVQQWSVTVCIDGGCQKPTFVSNQFTIHGLWPTNVSKPYPEFCKGRPPGSGKFSFPLISHLSAQLQTEWPDVVNKNNLKFWSGQWDKHGTCSLNKFTQDDYFQQALTIKGMINLIDVLKKAGVVPHKTKDYKIDDIVTAIKAHNGNNDIALVCTKSTNGNPIPYLKEIRLCLYPNGSTHTPCPPPLRSRDCANRNNRVILPI
ncbi:unnamed protein product [Lathyrus sativus]|nr:unnamed protein product [Lathyrus sativus]